MSSLTGLPAVLAGRIAPGVYRWHAAYAVDDVRRPVEEAGWTFAHLDGWSSVTAAAFHERIQQALSLPDHYGRNLDALADSLSDLAHPTLLLWDGWAPLALADERTFGLVLEILGAKADRLTVLLGGTGPDHGLPSLD